MLVAALAATRGNAQCTLGDSRGARARERLMTVGSAADDSARLGALVGACWGNSSLIRSSVSSMWPRDSSDAFSIAMLDPTWRTIRNSRIPVSFNDGALWAGRGTNVAIAAGFQAWYRNVHLVVDPQVVTSR